jgi:hypothetical protein
MSRKPCHKAVVRPALKIAVSLFVFWFTMGFGMAADQPIIYGEVSIGAASHPISSHGNEKPHCPLRGLPHLSGSLLPGQPSAAPRLDGFGPIGPDIVQTLISIDLAPPGHIPITS